MGVLARAANNAWYEAGDMHPRVHDQRGNLIHADGTY